MLPSVARSSSGRVGGQKNHTIDSLRYAVEDVRLVQLSHLIKYLNDPQTANTVDFIHCNPNDFRQRGKPE
jgi:hypothetical protein